MDEEDQHAHLCRPGELLAGPLSAFPSRSAAMQFELLFIN